MKLRNGFVSNSSSSSFVLDTLFLTTWQLKMIENHTQVAERVLNPKEAAAAEYGDYTPYEYYCDHSDRWDITRFTADGAQCIHLGTIIDNFDMKRFLREIDANHAVVYEDECESPGCAFSYFEKKGIRIVEEDEEYEC